MRFARRSRPLRSTALPRADLAGTAYTLIHNWLDRGGLGHRRPDGGVGSHRRCVVAALKARGGAMRSVRQVKTVLVDDSRVRGVRLADGGGDWLTPLAVSASVARATRLLDLGRTPAALVRWHTQSIQMRGFVRRQGAIS